MDKSDGMILILVLIFIFGIYRMNKQEENLRAWSMECIGRGGEIVDVSKNRKECFVNGKIVYIQTGEILK